MCLKVVFNFLALCIALASPSALASCHESLQEKAQREAKEFTHKYCPTPPINYISTDSVVFNANRNTFLYYCTFTDKLDDQEMIDLNKDKIKNILIQSVKESTRMKTYVEAGCHFHYYCHSEKDPKVVLYEIGF